MDKFLEFVVNYVFSFGTLLLIILGGFIWLMVGRVIRGAAIRLAVSIGIRVARLSALQQCRMAGRLICMCGMGQLIACVTRMSLT